MSRIMIAPSILSANFVDFGTELEAMEKAQADLLHFDVMDGRFVPEISFGEVLLRSVKKAAAIETDVHLMITEPEKHIPSFLQSGADRITFHLEATKDPLPGLRMIHEAGKKAALSIRPDTPLEALYPYLPECDMVLLMTVQPGFGGQPFLPGSLERIEALRAKIERQGLLTDLEVDGGINFDTVKKARDAGANVFVSGSALFKGDLFANIKRMRTLLTEDEETHA